MTEAEARTFIICLAALHDLGKITPGFQGCVPGADQLSGQPGYEPAPATARSPSHPRATHLALPELLHRQHGLPLTGRPTRNTAHQIGQLLGGHHGTYPLALSHQGDELTCPLAAAPGLGEKAWDEQREHLIPPDPRPLRQPRLAHPTGHWPRCRGHHRPGDPGRLARLPTAVDPRPPAPLGP
ncbi:HD domain-containing protein [Streptomyces dangxiongensis]|uniref:HD domain-containing protein n=1 Tax=Streptomyces dangxiongensis TaxID=1442032 RepID=UPI003742B2E8